MNKEQIQKIVREEIDKGNNNGSISQLNEYASELRDRIDRLTSVYLNECQMNSERSNHVESKIEIYSEVLGQINEILSGER